MTDDPGTARTGPGPRAGALAFFAPGLLGLVPAIVFAGVASDKSEAYEWAQHRLAGLGFATAFFLVFLVGRWRRNRFTTLAGAATLAALLLVIARERPASFHPLFLVAGIMVATGYWFSRRGEPGGRMEAGAVGLGAALSTWVAASLWWWEPIQVPFATWPAIVLFLGATAAMVGLLCALTRAPGSVHRGRFNYLLDGLVLTGLAAALLRTNAMDWARFPHHWSVYTAPADMVREGGWLLANVPSQYGFLTTLLLAVLPTDDRFTALYLVSTVVSWISGVIVYFALKTWLARWWWQLLAGLVTICCVAFLSGEASVLSGPLPYPSAGAMRFIWVFALLAFLLWLHGRAGPADFSRRHAPWIGGGLWLLGVLWSMESAAYVTAAWLPAATLLALPPAVTGLSRRARLRAFGAASARALVIPGVLLGLTLAGLTLCYRVGLGRSPDFSAYWEYATAFSAGFGALPIDPQGAVWVLLLVHTALLATLLDLETDAQRPSLVLIWAAWGAFWPITTYFVARSHSNNVVNLTPVMLLVVALLGHVWLRGDRRGLAAPWLWWVVSSLVGGMLWLVLANGPGLQHQLAEYGVEPRVARLLMPPRLSQVELLRACQELRPGSYSIIGENADAVDKIEMAWPHVDWLPLHSMPLFNPLPPARREFYLDAYPRGHGPGWLLFPDAAGTPTVDWLFTYIDARYTVELNLENKGWHARYYVPRAGVRPAPAPK